MSDAKAQADFHTERARLLEEREAAYETRSEDPERWRAAKQAYGEFRTAMRELDLRGPLATPVSTDEEEVG